MTTRVSSCTTYAAFGTGQRYIEPFGHVSSRLLGTYLGRNHGGEQARMPLSPRTMKSRTSGTVSQQTTTTTNDTYRVTGTRTATASGTITNAGLFDAASGGTLFMKGDFAGIALANGDAIAFTMNVQYS